MGEQDVLKMQQRKDFLIKFCYWAVIAVCICGFQISAASAFL